MNDYYGEEDPNANDYYPGGPFGGPLPNFGGNMKPVQPLRANNNNGRELEMINGKRY